MENVFNDRQLGLLQEETLVVFSTHAGHGKPSRQRGMKWRDARNSHLEQACSSVPKVKEQTDVKSSNSPEASPATRAENPLSVDGKMKKIVV